MEHKTALPNNIRQIGEVHGYEKIWIEDYVMTYIRKKERQEENGVLAILLGEREETEDSVCVFIRGILEICEDSKKPADQKETEAAEVTEESDAQETERKEAEEKEYEAAEEGKTYEELQKKYFPDWEVQGCCVIGTFPTERMTKLSEVLPEAGRMIYHLQEQEETLYWRAGDRYQRLRGYFVFYEQNRQMQQYLEDQFGDSSVEKESSPDRAIKSFRAKIQEKAVHRSGSFLKMAGSFFVITVLIIGAVVVNRIEELRTVRHLPAVTDQVGEPEGEGIRSRGQMEEVTNRQSQENETKTLEEAQEDSISPVSAGTDIQDFFGQSDGLEANVPGTGDGQEANTPGMGDGQEANTPGMGEGQEANTPGTGDGQEANVPGSGDGQEANTSGTGDGQEANILESGEGQGTDIPGQDGGMEAAGSDQEEEKDGRQAQEASVSGQRMAAYIIREGDTLADICNRYYGSLDRLAEVCETNQITDANKILPGQKILLP